MACSIDIIAVDRISYVQASSFKQARVQYELNGFHTVESTEGKSDKWCRRSNYDDVIYENQISLDLNCEKTRWEYSKEILERGSMYAKVVFL